MRSACFSIAKVMRIQVALASEWPFCIGADCMRVTVMGVEWAFINIWKTIRIYHYARYLFFVNEYHRSALSEAQKKKQLNGPLRRDGFQFFCSLVDDISCIVNAFSTFVRRRLQYAPGFYLDRFVHLRCSRCYRCTCRIHLYCNMLHCCHTGDLKNTHRYLKQRKTFLLPFQEI